MVLWFSALAVSLTLLGLLALWRLPFSLSSNLQGRADPSGGWALALGVALGPVALSAIAAAGVAPFITCHVFGKQLVRLPLSRWLRGVKKKEPKSAPETATESALEADAHPTSFSRFERSIAGFFRALDPVETLLAWWEKERLFEVRSLVVDLEYSFRDVALTGQILAALYVLSGVLPGRYVINQTPVWELEDRLAVAVDGRFRVWPGRLLVDFVGFVLEQRARQSAAPASE